MTTRKLTSVAASPSAKIAEPDEPPAVRTAYQMPRQPTASGISSFVVAASSANDRERNEPVLVEEPDREQDQRNREADRVESRRGERVELRRRIEEIREREVRPRRARLPRCLRASQ